MHDSVIDTKSD